MVRQRVSSGCKANAPVNVCFGGGAQPSPKAESGPACPTAFDRGCVKTRRLRLRGDSDRLQIGYQHQGQGSHAPAARRCLTCPMPGQGVATHTPSRHPSTSSINASLGNSDRRPPAAPDAGAGEPGPPPSIWCEVVDARKTLVPGATVAPPRRRIASASRRHAQVMKRYTATDGASGHWICYPLHD